jgi:hypothetical protein
MLLGFMSGDELTKKYALCGPESEKLYVAACDMDEINIEKEIIKALIKRSISYHPV